MFTYNGLWNVIRFIRLSGHKWIRCVFNYWLFRVGYRYVTKGMGFVGGETLVN
jgi:hypothetical protein